MTLEQMWQVELPEKMEGDVPTAEVPREGNDRIGTKTFMGIVQVLFEYLDLCVDWDRVNLPSLERSGSGNCASDSGTVSDPMTSVKQNAGSNLEKKSMLRSSLALLVAAAIRSGSSKEVMEELDKERSGIAMWRIP